MSAVKKVSGAAAPPSDAERAARFLRPPWRRKVGLLKACASTKQVATSVLLIVVGSSYFAQFLKLRINLLGATGYAPCRARTATVLVRQGGAPSQDIKTNLL